MDTTQIGIFSVFFMDCKGFYFDGKEMGLVAYKPNKDLNYLTALFESGKLKMAIDKCFPLAETADAFRHFGQGRFKGKAVVKIRA